ncbi:uncharacterized protein IWZ02DRAFT_433046 [Phyllosticta citriasiana]|uniref:uncharacterized protein n=1 Tax=Phyllosticta citriasiana TaxID=595635 RepID=UPI0030FDBF91
MFLISQHNKRFPARRPARQPANAGSSRPAASGASRAETNQYWRNRDQGAQRSLPNAPPARRTLQRQQIEGDGVAGPSPRGGNMPLDSPGLTWKRAPPGSTNGVLQGATAPTSPPPPPLKGEERLLRPGAASQGTTPPFPIPSGSLPPTPPRSTPPAGESGAGLNAGGSLTQLYSPPVDPGGGITPYYHAERFRLHGFKAAPGLDGNCGRYLPQTLYPDAVIPFREADSWRNRLYPTPWEQQWQNQMMPVLRQQMEMIRERQLQQQQLEQFLAERKRQEALRLQQQQIEEVLAGRKRQEALRSQHQRRRIEVEMGRIRTRQLHQQQPQ